MLVLQPVVAFDATVGLVAVFALLDDELDAVDAAVAFVDEVEIIDIAVSGRNTAGREGACAVSERGNELAFLGLGNADGAGRNGCGHTGHHQFFREHDGEPPLGFCLVGIAAGFRHGQ